MIKRILKNSFALPIILLLIPLVTIFAETPSEKVDNNIIYLLKVIFLNNKKEASLTLLIIGFGVILLVAFLFWRLVIYIRKKIENSNK